jgi:SAM-dependent methyltransferase
MSTPRAEMSRRAELKTVDTWDGDAEVLAAAIKALPGPVEILEAGCGRKWMLDLDGVDYRLTGIDLDPHALESRVTEVRDLDEAIVGDLSDRDAIGEGQYDVIYSSYVLEHVPDAELVLENMLRGLKPGGLLLLRFPDRKSAFGWTVRHTPFSIHVAYYRYVWRLEGAGKPGFAPYRTYYSPILSRDGIREFCDKHGCTILEELGNTNYVQGGTPRARITRAYVKAISALSLGALAWRHSDLTYVIRK